jgi:Ca2+-binding EF-hand superfamily protein
MNFDSFKKTFFPHLYLIEDSVDHDESTDMPQGDLGHYFDNLDEESRRKHKLQSLVTNKAKHQEIIQERVKKLEKILRERFSHFDSVRKAFLGLDTDYDGYITVEDILRYFG